MSNLNCCATTKTAKLLLGASVYSACAAVAVNAVLVAPVYAGFTETNFGAQQVLLAENAVCAEQLDEVIFGLNTSTIAADSIGLLAEAAGAVFSPSEIPGILAQAAALTFSTSAFALEQDAGRLPNCEASFLGSVKADGGASFKADSEFLAALAVNGRINAGSGINVSGLLNAYDGLVVQDGATFSGDVTFNNKVTVTQLLTGNGGLSITGNSTLNGSLQVNGNSQVNGNLTVTGAGSFGALAIASGLSVHSGAIWIGNTDGTSFQPGISVGGGALAGVGTGGAASAAGHRDAIAIGNGAVGAQEGSIAFGLTAKATAAYAIAVGSQAGSAGSAVNSVAVGRLANALGGNGAAVGFSASAGGLDAVAFGSNASAFGDRAAAVGVGSVASGTSSVAVGDTATATQAGAVAVGQNASATGVNAIAIGNGATATGSVSMGSFAGAANGGAAYGDGAQAVGLNSAALGTNAVATHANSIAIGSNSVTSVENTVSFGSVGAERRLMNVDDGILNSDAANLGQLRQAVAKLNRGVASTIALSVPMMALEPGETSVALGGGFYQGENGIALRGAYRPSTEWPMMFSGSVATAGNDSVTGQVGVAVKF